MLFALTFPSCPLFHIIRHQKLTKHHIFGCSARDNNDDDTVEEYYIQVNTIQLHEETFMHHNDH